MDSGTRVAQAKARSSSEIYEELGTPKGERKNHGIAQSRNKTTKDYTHIKHAKDENGPVLCSQDKIKMIWEKSYEKLLNEENSRMNFEDGVQNLGATQSFSRSEKKKQLMKIKNGKAIGPGGNPAEVWKNLGEGIEMMRDLIYKTYNRKRCQNSGEVALL